MTSQSHDRESEKKEPTTQDLEEPSTEKEVGQEPRGKKPQEPEPSHEAVGIGVIGEPIVETDGSPSDDPSR